MKGFSAVDKLMKQRKRQINKNQGAEEPEMPEIPFLKQAFQSQAKRIYDFVPEKKNRQRNQKIPERQFSKAGGSCEIRMGIRLFPGKAAENREP